MSDENLPTHVNGVEVIAVERVRSPLSKKAPVYFTGTRELLLADGATLYACVYCGHTEEKIGRIRSPHQAFQCPNNPKRKAVTTRGAVPRASNPPKVEMNGHDEDEADDLLAALELALGGSARIAELTAERDAAHLEVERWRRRAMDAEHKIALVRRRLKDHL